MVRSTVAAGAILIGVAGHAVGAADLSVSPGATRDFEVTVPRSSQAPSGPLVLSLRLSGQLPQGSHLVITSADGRVLGTITPYGSGGTGEKPRYTVLVPANVVERQPDGSGRVAMRAQLRGPAPNSAGRPITVTPEIQAGRG